jgi:hypothetical protein
MSKATREAAPHVGASQHNVVKCLSRRPAFEPTPSYTDDCFQRTLLSNDGAGRIPAGVVDLKRTLRRASVELRPRFLPLRFG